MDVGASVPLDWPAERTGYLTLDLECDFGTALAENTYGALEHVPRLVALLEEHGIPLTCFVQTEVLDVAPAAVEALRNGGVDVAFHPHSHTHGKREETSMAEEITVSTERFRAYFGREPTGYRLPDGDVWRGDYAVLADHGYAFDASVFPSWRPGRFDNRSAVLHPEYLPDLDLFELPFTVLSERIRIPTALSYCRLLGRPFTAALERWPPSTVVFNVHLHDLVTPESYRRLSPAYRAVYARNDHGFRLLEAVLGRFRSAGYSFGTIDEAHEALRERTTDEAEDPPRRR